MRAILLLVLAAGCSGERDATPMAKPKQNLAIPDKTPEPSPLAGAVIDVRQALVDMGIESSAGWDYNRGHIHNERKLMIESPSCDKDLITKLLEAAYNESQLEHVGICCVECTAPGGKTHRKIWGACAEGEEFLAQAKREQKRKKKKKSTWKPKPKPKKKTCCKICRKGCACGDSCISCSKVCRRGPGCACNG